MATFVRLQCSFISSPYHGVTKAVSNPISSSGAVLWILSFVLVQFHTCWPPYCLACLFTMWIASFSKFGITHSGRVFSQDEHFLHLSKWRILTIDRIVKTSHPYYWQACSSLLLIALFIFTIDRIVKTGHPYYLPFLHTSIGLWKSAASCHPYYLPFFHTSIGLWKSAASCHTGACKRSDKYCDLLILPGTGRLSEKGRNKISHSSNETTTSSWSSRLVYGDCISVGIVLLWGFYYYGDSTEPT